MRARPTPPLLFTAAVILCLWSLGSSECPNACNGKGICGARDTCSCYKGWMGNDCSQRICQFGLAHVDIQKGDLDGTGIITGPSQIVSLNSQMFRYGTSEKFVNMMDSDQRVLTNTAHEYTECSNKGRCDRDKGTCYCLAGYEGSACQYASCPNRCSGHGVCLSARELAKLDGGNNYELWDADVTLGCKCDPGFTGPDCSMKTCKVGYDPLYRDPGNSHRYSNWSYVIYHMANDTRIPIKGNYSIIFYDQTGEEWRTGPITYGASCTAVTRALESLPNNVVPSGTVRCTQWLDYSRITNADEPMLGGACLQYVGCQGNWRSKVLIPFRGIKYTLAFPANPGKLKPLEINWFLDGYRPSLATTEYKSTLGAFVYANGFTGEDTDYFTNKCVGVDVNLASTGDSPSQSVSTILTGLTPLEFRYLAVCLGESDESPDFSATVTVGGRAYTWDYGSPTWPHIVRLVDQTTTPATDLCDEPSVDNNSPFAGTGTVDVGRDGARSSTVQGRSCVLPSHPPGFLAVVYYDPVAQVFKILNRPGEDYSPTTQFSVFTTTGVACMVSGAAKVYTDKRLPYQRTVYTTNSSRIYPKYRGNLDCLENRPPQNGAIKCIEKGDTIFFLDPVFPANNPKYINLHTIERVYTANSNMVSIGSSPGYVRIVLDSAPTMYWPNQDPTVNGRVYKFSPPSLRDPPERSYRYVSECSNRGVCDVLTGLCECFTSFMGDDCSVQNNFGV